MRIGLLACLIVLLSMAPITQAQDNLLPPCSDAQLATLAEIQPAFESLLADRPSITDRASFAPYINTYFTWRAQLWSQLPLCAEMLQIAALMDRIASNLAAIPALDAALLASPTPKQQNPFDAEDLGADSLPRQLRGWMKVVQARQKDDTNVPPAGSDLPACADGDYDVFYDQVYDPYLELIELFQAGGGMRSLLRTVEWVLEWRDQVWHGLPACAGMIEITWPMTQAASDFAVYAVFDTANMQPEAGLYHAETARVSATITAMAPAFLGKDASDAAALESSLPGCARSQLNVFNNVILEYAELVGATEDIESLDDLLALARRQSEWRDQRLANLPRCAEAFEMGLLIDQATGDVILALAFLLSGFDAGEIPHVQAIEEGTAKMSALVTPILQGERAGADARVPLPLAQCADAELALITTEIEPDFWALIDADVAAETVDDLFLLGAMQIEFRETVWSRLPACAEAYDIAWRMVRVTGDSLLTWALVVAGVAEDDVPYAATANDMRPLTELLLEIAAAAGAKED